MRRVNFRFFRASHLAGVLLAAAALHAHAGVIVPDLERSMALRGTHADTRIIVRFADQVDIRAFEVKDRRQRDNRLLVALKARSARNMASFKPLLDAHEATGVQELWLINAIAAKVPAVAVKQLAQHPDVASVGLDSLVQTGRPQRTPLSRNQARSSRGNAPPVAAVPAPGAPDAGALSGLVPQQPAATAAARAEPAWNVAAVHAPDLWAQGHTGKGVVVAAMDTGVDLDHPQLRRRWRGGANSWFDPHGEEPSPYDMLGHGTQAAGVIVAGEGLGIAPDARWIAVRLYDGDGRAGMSDIHRAFQWLMDPDGEAATIDAPDIVNMSWALSGRGAGACNLEFSDDMRVLRSAGIVLVFAAGNDGPGAGTSNSPGNNPGALSVGAVDRDLAVARQTSRGPSACDGAVFPRLVAPGVNIRTTDLSHGGQPSYTVVSGSSLASPHAAGVLALLAGAFPAASVAELEDALLRGARDVGAPGADNNYGHGLVDALAAFNALRAAQNRGASRASAAADGATGNDSADAQSTFALFAPHALARRSNAPTQEQFNLRSLP